MQADWTRGSRKEVISRMATFGVVNNPLEEQKIEDDNRHSQPRDNQHVERGLASNGVEWDGRES